MGRKMLPTQLKVMRGTAQNCRLNPDEPEPGVDDIVKPKNLSPIASKHWDAVLKQLMAAGVMSNMDASALALYCDAYGRYTESSAEVDKQGSVSESASGHPMVNPHIAIINKAFEQMAKLLVEFGMTPASRAKVSSSKTKTKSANRFAS